jgi:hypothetical protein
VLVGKVKTGFSQFNAKTLMGKARAAIKGLTGNDNFPTPEPDLPSIQALVDALQAADTAAESGDREAIKTREQARLNLMVSMQSLGNYVNFTANGSLEQAATSGMDLYKTPQTVTVQPIKRLKVENKPNTNALDIMAVGGKGAKTFVFQYAIAGGKLDDEASWTNVTSTTRKCRISNLLKNTEYAVKAMGVGPKGQTVISDVVIRIVQ